MIEIKFFYNENSYCKKETKTLNRLLELYPDIKLSKFTKESEEGLRYKIKGVPWVIFEKDGEYFDKVIGGGPLSFYTSIVKKIYNE